MKPFNPFGNDEGGPNYEDLLEEQEEVVDPSPLANIPALRKMLQASATAQPTTSSPQVMEGQTDLTQAAPQPMSEDEFTQAQQERATADDFGMASRLGESLLQIGAGAGGIQYSPDFSASDFLAKVRGRKAEDLKEKQAFEKGKLGLGMSQLDYNSEQQLADPNSEISKQYRELAGKLVKSPISQNLSAAQLAKTLPIIQQIAAAEKAKLESDSPYRQALMDWRMGNLDAKRQGLGLSKERLDWNKIQRDELSDKQVETITGIDNVMDDLEKLEGLKQEFTTGPIEGRVERIKAYIGKQKGARAALQSQIKKVLSAYGKAISGAAIGEQEFARLEEQIPKDTDSDEMFADKLANFKDSIENSRYRIIDNVIKSGKDASNFINRESAEQVKQRLTGQAKGKYPPGTLLKVKGKQYRVGEDGNSLKEVK